MRVNERNCMKNIHGNSSEKNIISKRLRRIINIKHWLNAFFLSEKSSFEFLFLSLSFSNFISNNEIYIYTWISRISVFILPYNWISNFFPFDFRNTACLHYFSLHLSSFNPYLGPSFQSPPLSILLHFPLLPLILHHLEHLPFIIFNASNLHIAPQ